MNEEQPVDVDHRLYTTHPDSWAAHIKRTAEKEYCYIKTPGEDYFHLLTKGEIYLERLGEKYCLNCALRHGELTRNRMHWQRAESEDQ